MLNSSYLAKTNSYLAKRNYHHTKEKFDLHG